MSCILLALLPPLLLGLLAAPVPGRPASAPLVRRLAAGYPAAPPDSGRATRVRGTVRLAQSGRPLAGVLLAIESCSFGYFGATGFAFVGDSARTDAQGRYELRFRAQPGESYVVRFDPGIGRQFGQPSRFVFSTNARVVGPSELADIRYLTPGADTIADFAPDFAPDNGQPIDLHLPPPGH